MKECKIGLIGIGGIGKAHAETIIELIEEGKAECVAFADPFAHKSREIYEKLIRTGAKYYGDYQDMLKHHPEMTFVSIVTPIHLHKPMSINAMQRGFHVLLEKPPVVTIQDLDEIIEISKETNKLCGVCFQRTSGKAFRTLLEDIQKGHLGKLKSVSTLGMWKRSETYYERNSWAGKLKVNGNYVLDGPINNPFAHFLNNSLILAGYGDPLKATPKVVQAELYKGHNIESEDTDCVRIQTRNGVEVRFYTTLCSATENTAYIQVEGIKGKAIWQDNNVLYYTDDKGEEKELIFDEENYFKNMYVNFTEVIEDKNKKLLSSIQDCRSFILSSNGAFESARQIHGIPEKHLTIIEKDGTIDTYINHIGCIFHNCLAEGKLFSELSIDWAVSSEPFAMNNYTKFNMF